MANLNQISSSWFSSDPALALGGVRGMNHQMEMSPFLSPSLSLSSFVHGSLTNNITSLCDTCVVGKAATGYGVSVAAPCVEIWE